jgi:hypothetical protein
MQLTKSTTTVPFWAPPPINTTGLPLISKHLNIDIFVFGSWIIKEFEKNFLSTKSKTNQKGN